MKIVFQNDEISNRGLKIHYMTTSFTAQSRITDVISNLQSAHIAIDRQRIVVNVI